MGIKIFYFSTTGNSLQIARNIAPRRSRQTEICEIEKRSRTIRVWFIK